MPVPDLRFAATLIEQGQTAKARGLLEKLVTLVPSYVAAYVLLARLAESERRYEDALVHWQDAHGLAPMSPVIKEGLEGAILRLHTTSERRAPRVAAADMDDLDRLIEELETARIVSNPDIDDIPAEDLQDEIEDVVSETLAKIYAAQRYFDEAGRVYEKLAVQNSDRSEEFGKKAVEMRRRASRNS